MTAGTAPQLPPVYLERVSRWYGQIIGLNDVTCAFQPGLTALLGPNGAGKSTMLKLITGQLRPGTGRVQVFGMKPFANARVYQRLGYIPEIENSYDEMTGREFVTMLGSMAGLRPPKLHSRVAEVIEQVDMTPNADRHIGGYSKGMRQRIKLAQALVHDPEILILDEPLNGLDPLGRRHISQLMQQFAAQGRCVIVSSHILHEVEQLTHNLVLINKGRLLAQGDIYQIRSLIDRHPHRISIETDRTRDLAKRLIDLPYVLTVRFSTATTSSVEVETHAPEQFYAQFPEIVLQDGFVVRRYESPDNNLEAVFRYLVGE